MYGNILLFIASEKGYTALRRLTTQKNTGKVGAVITFKEVDVDKSWDIDIRNECTKNGIPFYFWKDAKDRLIEIIQKNNCICAITIAWKFLLPMKINDYLQYPLIVFHDSLLPKYRGFAPTPTAIMCGETDIGVTAIFANAQVDEGDIVAQKSVYVPETMYIKDVVTKHYKPKFHHVYTIPSFHIMLNFFYFTSSIYTIKSRLRQGVRGDGRGSKPV